MNKNENIFTTLNKAFYTELETIVQQVLVDAGIKKNSDLANSVEFTTSNSRDSLYMICNSYYRDVSNGRKPGVRKIPLQRLIAFIKKNGISGDVVAIAVRMQRSIYKKGIQGKNFIEKVEDSTGDYVELKVADFITDQIADDMINQFSVNGKNITTTAS